MKNVDVTYMKLIFVLLFFLSVVTSAMAEISYVFGPDVSTADQKRIVQAAEKAEAELQKRFSFRPVKGTTLFASSNTQFLAETYSRMRGGTDVAWKKKQIDSWIFAEAFYRGVMINLSNNNAKRPYAIENAVIHEFFHVFQYEIVGPKSKRCCAGDRVSVVGPTWLMEGSAAYFQNVVDRKNLNGFLQHGKKNKHKLGQKGLAGIETFQGMNKVQNGYAISGYAVSQLVNLSNESSIEQYYRYIGLGKSWKSAFQNSFGVTVEEFYTQF